MKKTGLIVIVAIIILFSTNAAVLRAEEKAKPTTVEILNSEYTKPPDTNDNVEIDTASTVENILKKTDYYYATRNFDKAIELCWLALTKTNDKLLIAKINFSLSSNYLEKGIEPYIKNKDDSFYKLSIESAKKCLEVMSDNWQALANLGSVYLNMRDWKQSVFYFSQAQKYLDKNDPVYAEIEFSRRAAEEMDKKSQN